MADESIRSVQAIATDLRPAVLDSLGLCAAVEWKARDFESHVGIQCQVELPKEELVVSRDVATATFRIVQESLTNVIRHAKASKVTIVLRQESGCLVLEVDDNGCGIPAELLNDPMCIGLAGMRERALLFGGQFAIHSQPGEGTKIEMRLPLLQTDTVSAGEE
jgi:signal transduction histidine kinase